MIGKLQVHKQDAPPLIENARDAMYVSTSEGRFVYVNQAATELFGYSKQELKDLFLDDLLLDSREIVQLNNQLMQSGCVEKFETKLQKKNGTEILCLLMIFSTHNNVGEIMELQGTVYNITTNKRIEDQLRTTQKYTQSIIDSSIDMIIASDQSKNIVEFNRAAQKTFGYRPEEVLGQPVSLLYNDKDESQLLHDDTLYKGHQVQEVTCKRKNGEIFPAFLSSSVLRNIHGVVVGAMGISRDITHEKLKESELKLLSTAIEQTADSIIITDSFGIIQYANPAYETLTGYSRNALLGQDGFPLQNGSKEKKNCKAYGIH